MIVALFRLLCVIVRTEHYGDDFISKQNAKFILSSQFKMQGVWSLDDKNDKEGAFDIMIEDSGNGLWHVMGQTFSKVDSSRNEKIANFA